MRAEQVSEVGWVCAACGTPQRSPWPELLVVEEGDTWAPVRAAAELECGECSARALNQRPIVLVDDPEDPGFVVACGEGEVATERLSPWYRRMLDAMDWPAGDGPILHDPGVVRIVAARARLRRLGDAVGALISVNDPDDLTRLLAEHPDVRTPEAVTALDDLFAAAGLPPEGKAYRQAFLDLFESDAGEAAVRRFIAGREAGQNVLAEAGRREMEWLLDHRNDPDRAAWDEIARSALNLLGFAGRAAERAQLLFVVGTAVDGRGTKSVEEIDWAIHCLEDCYDLTIDMEDAEHAAAAAENLALALQSRRRGDMIADTVEGERLLTSVLEYRRSQGDRTGWAQAATNLAVILLRRFALDGDVRLVERAVALGREALPLRPRNDDPTGWAFTATNLAMALTRADISPEPFRERLLEAIELLREVWPAFAAQGSTMNAHKMRIDLCRTLVSLGETYRTDLVHQRLENIIGRPADHFAFQLFRSMAANPRMFSLDEVPAELAGLYTAPPEQDEREPLAEALALAQVGLEETRLTGDTERRSEYARITAVITERLFGDSEEAVRRLTAAREQIDHRFAPAAAWETARALADLRARRGEWRAARQAFDDCLALRDRALTEAGGRETTLGHLRRHPALARAAVISRIRDGDVTGAVELAERSRLLSYAEVSGDLRFGSAGLLRSASATAAEIGRAAPLAYVVTSPWGSAVLLVRRDASGEVIVTAYDSEITSGDFMALFNNANDPGSGLMSAQRSGLDPGPAVARMTGPLGRLMQPVVDVLHADGIERLLLVPTGPASAYPWTAASVSDPATGATVALADLLVLSQAPSAMAALYSRRRAAAAATGGPIAVFADPVREDASRLPGAAAEAAAIAAAFPGRTRVRTGADATREEVLAALPRSRITHLACHGTNAWEQFMAMRLLLSDGDITLDDLRRLPVLDSRLVFLSACQTGHADVFRLSDEMIGLPFTLLAGGAAAVVSTLWPVGDEVTAKLVTHFYAELKADPDDVPAALNRARLAVRASVADEPGLRRELTAVHAGTPSYDWAAFVCHGT